MSESAPETSGGGGNVFTRKIGPLPMWGWMAIAMLLAVFYYLYHKNQQSATASSTAATGAAANTPGGVDASLVPQFVNQVYNQETPPTAPNVTVNNTVPPATSSATLPAYGAAGTSNQTFQAITPAEAQILMSSNNLYNTAGRAAQRPFIWNGAAYVPNTNPINSSYQYYAGPLETQEIQAYEKKNPQAAAKSGTVV